MTNNNFISHELKRENTNANSTLVISISISSIYPNKLNEEFYNKLDDDARTVELAESILFDGLIDLMSVKVDPDDDEKYILISGHRRLKALNYIVNELKIDSFKFVKVKLLEFESLDHERIALLRANTTQRYLKPYDIIMHAKEVKRLSDKLYSTDNSNLKRATQLIASQLNMSEVRVYQLLELDKKLDETQLNALKEERINTFTARKIASLKNDQKQAVSDFLINNPEASETEIKKVVNSELENKPSKPKRTNYRLSKNLSAKEDYLLLYKNHLKKFKDDPHALALEELLFEQINLIFK